MNTKVVDTFESSESRLQAVLSRTCDRKPPEGGTPNCKLTNEGCRLFVISFEPETPDNQLMKLFP